MCGTDRKELKRMGAGSVSIRKDASTYRVRIEQDLFESMGDFDKAGCIGEVHCKMTCTELGH